MLQATLPEISRKKLTEEIIARPLVTEVRYNVGAVSPFSPKKTLGILRALTEKHGKRLWIDLKGKQLRIKRWSSKKYGRILLNHDIEVNCPAKVYFRGDSISEITYVRKNQIFVDPPPKYAVGEGQAINVQGDNLFIKGYLTAEDKKYIKAACELGILDLMLSFVEEENDVLEVENFLNSQPGYDAQINPAMLVYKIETQKGLLYALGLAKIDASYFIKRPISLMAARDDLMINIGQNKFMMLEALEWIIKADPDAILASRIFGGLETAGQVTMGDISDLKLMKMMGYKKFLLSDGICQNHFSETMKAWEQYLDIYGE